MIELVERKGLLKVDIVARRITKPEVMHLSRQLGAFIHAGLPLVDAVHSLGTQSQNPPMRRLMATVEDRLRSGVMLSDCLDSYGHVEAGAAAAAPVRVPDEGVPCDTGVLEVEVEVEVDDDLRYLLVRRVELLGQEPADDADLARAMAMAVDGRPSPPPEAGDP